MKIAYLKGNRVENKEKYMKVALEEAQKAFDIGEVPIGAVIVKDGKIIGRGHNNRESMKNPLGHAELIAIKDASVQIDAWRLSECDLYVTIEPCLMCTGAILQSRIANLYYGGSDYKGGGVESLAKLLDISATNHKTEYEGGILQDECSKIMKDFFKKLRNK